MSFNISYSTYSVDLPNPQLEDIRRFSSQSIKRRTPGGVVKVFKDDDWPVVETFIYDFVRLTQTQRDDLLELLEAGAGLEVSTNDHYGASRTGYIVTPVAEIVTVRDDCFYDIHFEFMSNIIVNIVGDCPQDAVPDTPVPGDSDYHQTLDNDDFYRIYAEDNDPMEAEDGSPLYIEGF